VYELYGLTPEEVALVESATAPQPAAGESEAPEPAPEKTKPSRIPQGQSTPQSEADAAHFYFVKEDPPALGKE
jgi:hypothetical protein